MNSQGRMVKIHFSIRNTIPDTNLSQTTTIRFPILFPLFIINRPIDFLDKPNTS